MWGIMWKFKGLLLLHIWSLRVLFIYWGRNHSPCWVTLSLMVGRSWMRMKRKATTGRIQRRDVRKMVSQTLGWFREFLAVPSHGKSIYYHTAWLFLNEEMCYFLQFTHQWRGKRRWRWGTCRCCTWLTWWQSKRPGCPTQKNGSLPSSNRCPDTTAKNAKALSFLNLSASSFPIYV